MIGRVLLLALCAGCAAAAIGVGSLVGPQVMIPGAVQEGEALEVSASKVLFARIVLVVVALTALAGGIFYTAVCRWFARVAERAEARWGPGPVVADEPTATENRLLAFFWFLIVIPPIVVLLNPKLGIKQIKEDGPLETLSVFLYLTACVLCARDALRPHISRGLRFFLGCHALLFFVVAGEELSWGQRILGFETPESLSNLNVQDEFSLHNVWSTSLSTYFALAVTSSLLVFLPLLNHWSTTWRRLIGAVGFPVAPARYALLYVVSLVPMIITGAYFGTLGFGPFSLWGRQPNMDDEFFEVCLAYLFFLVAVIGWRIVPPDGKPSAKTP